MKIASAALLLGVWALLPPAAGAADPGASWLKISPGVRESAMGGSGSAFAGADSLDLNPAGLAQLDGPQVSLSQSFWVQDLSLSHLAWAQPLGDGSVLALGGDAMGFGTVNRYVVTGGLPFSDGTYSPMGLNLAAGYARCLSPNLEAGVAARFLYDTIQTSSGQAAAFDAGLLYRLPGTGLSLQGSVNDLGGSLDGADLPMRLRLGADYRLDRGKQTGEGSLDLSLEESLPLVGGSSSLGMGGEYWLIRNLAIRAGYRFADTGSLDGLSGLALGVGVKYMDWKLDYALTTLGDLGTTHQIALGLDFGGKGPATRVDLTAPSEFILGAQSLKIADDIQDREGVREWKAWIEDSKGTRVWAQSGQGAPPEGFAWDGENPQGFLVGQDQYRAWLEVKQGEEGKGRSEPLSFLAKEAPPEIPGWESLNVSENLQFDSGTDELTGSDRERLAEAARTIFAKYPGCLILVAGHTDNRDLKESKFTTNRELSLARARAARDGLVRDGVKPKFLRVAGFGAERPIVSNATPEGQAKNRRVELLVYRKKP